MQIDVKTIFVLIRQRVDFLVAQPEISRQIAETAFVRRPADEEIRLLSKIASTLQDRPTAAVRLHVAKDAKRFRTRARPLEKIEVDDRRGRAAARLTKSRRFRLFVCRRDKLRYNRQRRIHATPLDRWPWHEHKNSQRSNSRLRRRSERSIEQLVSDLDSERRAE